VNKVAVTGASGHIGANLVRLLIKRGYEVVVLVRQSSLALKGLDVKTLKGDITDLSSLCAAFRGVEQVYHLAAYISILDGEREKLEQVNIEGTRNVLKACQSEAVSTLIHFSSIHALDQRPLDRMMNEENALLEGRRGHGSDYDFSKAEADRLVRRNDCGSFSTRLIYPTAVIGPNDFNGSLAGQVIRKISKGRLPALVSGGFDWVDARDVAWAAIEAAEKGVDQDRFILSGHYRDMKQVAATVAELSGVPAPRLSSPVWLARVFAPFMGLWARVQGEAPLYTQGSLAALSANQNMSHAKAAEQLAYQPRAFGESIRDALLFYQAQEEDSTGGDGN
jgi:dihydroflavonol-4-reductase